MMKNLAFLLLAIPLMFTACEKADTTDYTNIMDITEYQWRLLEITTDDSYYKVVVIGNTHMLDFQNETLFKFGLSMNTALARCNIEEQGKINIAQPVSTKICCDSDGDIAFINNLRNVTTYEVLGNKLYFRGPNNLEIKFKQE
jgi:hypothetical protein